MHEEEDVMRRIQWLVAIAALSGFAGTVQAEVLSGGPVYGGSQSVGGTITCRVYNAGSHSVTLTPRQIWNNAGGQATLSSDTCNVSLAPNKTCAFAAPITGNFAFSCQTSEESIDGAVRGVAEIQDSSHAVLNTVPLTK
jgi:hypothetical protein